MPNPIKAFFEKKKAEAKFKMAGPGQKLGDAAAAAEQRARQQQQASAQRGATSRRQQPHQQGAAAATAAQAALARLEVRADGGEDFERKRSQAVIRAQAQRELERERKVGQKRRNLPPPFISPRHHVLFFPSSGRRRDRATPLHLWGEEAPGGGGGALRVQGSLLPLPPHRRRGQFDAGATNDEFRLSMCGFLPSQVLPKKEMKERIRHFLYSQLEEEKGLTAALIIHTFAKDTEKVGSEKENIKTKTTLPPFFWVMKLNPSEEEENVPDETLKVMSVIKSPVGWSGTSLVWMGW